MNCDEARALVHAYLDGELDVARSVEFDHHVAGCTECRATYESQRALAGGIREAAPYYSAPAELRKRVRSEVVEENRRLNGLPATKWGSLAGLRWAVLAPVALLLVAFIAWGAVRWQQSASRNDLVAQEVLASSMRALMAGPLTDVASSDQHTVKPWFAGKLDFSPTVQDFAANGFPLAGGRLDYVDGRPVAALVYRHQQHVINLYTWPSPGSAGASLQESTDHGYHVFRWARGGMAYWAVSDMDAAELRHFAELVQQS